MAAGSQHIAVIVDQDTLDPGGTEFDSESGFSVLNQFFNLLAHFLPPLKNNNGNCSTAFAYIVND